MYKNYDETERFDDDEEELLLLLLTITVLWLNNTSDAWTGEWTGCW